MNSPLGCDGCINQANPDNVGVWLGTVNRMNALYDEASLTCLMSRADFYQLIGLIGIEVGIENANLIRAADDQITMVSDYCFIKIAALLNFTDLPRSSLTSHSSMAVRTAAPVRTALSFMTLGVDILIGKKSVIS